ncbi:MAG: metalloregulator ArsR/SmtB family transcription factor [Pseudomonadota bacterium]|jgi:DNA-binding transcriptional ArsR family regulator
MSADLNQREIAEEVSERLRILAQPTRLMILSLLRAGERSVGEIEKTLGLKQPGLSQQLGELRQADMVTTRREAKSIYYKLADDRVELLVSVLERVLGAGHAHLGELGTPKAPAPPRVSQGREAAMFARIHKQGAG